MDTRVQQGGHLDGEECISSDGQLLDSLHTAGIMWDVRVFCGMMIG